jgi:hypothetical protein
VRKLFEAETNAQKVFSFTATTTNQLVPIRVFYANRLGPGFFQGGNHTFNAFTSQL